MQRWCKVRRGGAVIPARLENELKAIRTTTDANRLARLIATKPPVGSIPHIDECWRHSVLARLVPGSFGDPSGFWMLHAERLLASLISTTALSSEVASEPVWSADDLQAVIADMRGMQAPPVRRLLQAGLGEARSSRVQDLARLAARYLLFIGTVDSRFRWNVYAAAANAWCWHLGRDERMYPAELADLAGDGKL